LKPAQDKRVGHKREEAMRIDAALVALAGLLVTTPVSTPALAQVPPELVDKIAAIGRVSDPAKTAPLYAPMHAKEPYSSVKVTRDVKYGPHERNRLDLFVPEGNGAGRPILMFVHGGGFIRGTKRAPGSPFYDNIMLWATRNGIIGINVEYRLAPQSSGLPAART
jgi:triacylglycerol lipase